MQCRGKEVTLKLKLVTFKVITRSIPLQRSSNELGEILEAASKLLSRAVNDYCLENPAPSFQLEMPCRLMGIRLSNLEFEVDTSKRGIMHWLVDSRGLPEEQVLVVPESKKPKKGPGLKISDFLVPGLAEGKNHVMCFVCGSDLSDFGNAGVNAHIDACIKLDQLN